MNSFWLIPASVPAGIEKLSRVFGVITASFLLVGCASTSRNISHERGDGFLYLNCLKTNDLILIAATLDVEIHNNASAGRLTGGFATINLQPGTSKGSSQFGEVRLSITGVTALSNNVRFDCRIDGPVNENLRLTGQWGNLAMPLTNSLLLRGGSEGEQTLKERAITMQRQGVTTLPLTIERVLK